MVPSKYWYHQTLGPSELVPELVWTCLCLREWDEGKVLIFDDSFEHEVWQEADSYRLIFIVDVWHPELTQYQRQTLSPI